MPSHLYSIKILAIFLIHLSTPCTFAQSNTESFHFRDYGDFNSFCTNVKSATNNVTCDTLTASRINKVTFRVCNKILEYEAYNWKGASFSLKPKSSEPILGNNLNRFFRSRLQNNPGTGFSYYATRIDEHCQQTAIDSPAPAPSICNQRPNSIECLRKIR